MLRINFGKHYSLIIPLNFLKCKHKLSLNENDFFCCDCGFKLLDQLDPIWKGDLKNDN